MTLRPQLMDIGRPLDAPILTFDLPVLLEKIKSDEDWRSQERTAMTLHKSEGMKVVLVAIHAGSSIPSHTAADPFSLFMIEGSIRFTGNKKTTRLQRGQMLTMHAGIPHEIEALEEASFLLTLASGQKFPGQSSGR